MRRDSAPPIRRGALGLAVLAACLAPSLAGAQSVDLRADATAEIRLNGGPSTDNGTIGNVLTSGIRQFAGNPDGTSDLFMNVEGPGIASPDFRSFAVADFTLPSLAGVTDVVGATLTLYEAPAAFGVSGSLGVYLLNDTDPDLISVAANPSAATPQYQGTNIGAAAIDPAFSVGGLLGTGTYTNSGIAGNPTVISLIFEGADLAALLSTLGAGGTLRLGIAPGDPTVAAALAGQTFIIPGTNDSGAPQLQFRAVPEPTAAALLVVGGLGLAVVARRRRAV